MPAQPAQAKGGRKGVPSVGGGKEREVLKIEDPGSNQPVTKTGLIKPPPNDDKVKSDGMKKK
uniref:Uncharacterized protein n=1 Tax=Oryza punctata TaxID=4537 RepID=A0A0E0LU29_ORYPU